MNKENSFFQEIGLFYESKMAAFWKLIHNEQMHVGYWDETNSNAGMQGGSVKLTEIMIDFVPIKKEQYFIDIGCGYGVPGIWLAQKKKCKVEGVTASQSQCDKANLNVKAANISDKVRFYVNDANKLRFAKETFDGGWMFESIFHIGHESSLAEANRVLKHDSTLIISDFTVSKSIPNDKLEYLKETFKVKTLKSIDDYNELFKNTGFVDIQFNDITKNTIAKRTQKYQVTLQNYKEQIVQEIGLDNFNWIKDFWTKINDEIFDKYIGYVIISVKKN